MLYFSETGWTLPDIAAVADEFDAHYNQPEYEERIAGLIRNARKRAREVGREESAAWLDAIRTLEKGDHYLLVMIDRAGRVRPRFDLLKLLATAFAVSVAGVSLLYLARRLGMDLAGVTFLVRAVTAGAFIAYGLAWVVLGRERHGYWPTSSAAFPGGTNRLLACSTYAIRWDATTAMNSRDVITLACFQNFGK